MTIDTQQLRRTLGLFTTGVTVVTTRDGHDEPVGMTANSFSSVSLDPPIVLWSIRKASRSHAVFTEAEHFAINVLANGQRDLAQRFAGPAEERFAAGVWRPGAGDVPVLADALARFECRRIGRVDMGDHTVLFGAVLAFAGADQPPLVFFQGRFAAVEPQLRAA